ncbi:MAG: zinc ribbon domain-containing protein [Gammaproteobacteria bacterium]|nr:zinc ribbon domain-containing protein [Gammaproteobacteria bacterium]MYF66752.1 zinc ribbon domain-containing protein [Gammaproteobacteria bacterium]MYK36935.1 zinc ribbon domain-containing protein [Gammaproteobacteria bacterium]
MPIYEYQCRECGYRLDALQKMSDPRLRDCPACGRPALKKLVSAPHFRLKGSGWYETDFKNSGRDQQDGAGKDAGNGAGKPASDTGGKDKSGSSSGKESGTSPASDAAAA